MSHAAHRHSIARLGGSIFRAGLGPLRGQRREIARFIALSDASSLLRVLGSQADVLILGAFVSNSVVGGYRLARQLLAPALSLITPLSSVLLQRLATVVAEDGERAAQRLATTTGKRIGAPFSLVFVAGALLAPWLIAAAGGSGYDSAVGPTRWLMALGALWTVSFWVQPLILALGRLRRWAAINLVGTITTLFGFWILGERFGASGVAASRTLGMAVLIQGLGMWLATRQPTSRRDHADLTTKP